MHHNHVNAPQRPRGPQLGEVPPDDATHIRPAAEAPLPKLPKSASHAGIPGKFTETKPKRMGKINLPLVSGAFNKRSPASFLQIATLQSGPFFIVDQGSPYREGRG